MIALIQRSDKASVSVDERVVGSIDGGLVVFIGVFKDDSEEECEYLAKKISTLRIFSDENDKMNLSVTDLNLGVLAISNFTLCANARKGTRPSYDMAQRPERANELYELFCEKLRENNVAKVEKGVFGAHMKVNVENNGPVSVILDTKEIMHKK